MKRRADRYVILVAVTLCVLASAAVAAPLAAAKSYTDVTAACWAKGAIESVTDVGPFDNKALDDYGSVFKPEQAITRAQLARALVILGGHEGETVDPRDIPDMPPPPMAHPYYWDVQLALHYGYMSFTKKSGKTGFYPDSPMTAAGVETCTIRWLKARFPSSDWSMLKALKNGAWQPVPGWRPKVSSSFPSIVASRQLLLRFNHPTQADAHEVNPSQRIDRAEVAYILQKAAAVTSGGLWGLPKYDSVTLPPLSDRQKQVLQFALKFVGYPYIWAGEWPTKNSPYGYQAAGGFDCSGFTFYVMQCHFGYPVKGRGAGDQAKLAKPRIGRKSLLPGDLIFFGYDGPKSSIGDIYHAAIYMGNGWFIHSTGSSDGVTIASLDDPSNSYWKTYFAWGRRLLSPAELAD